MPRSCVEETLRAAAGILGAISIFYFGTAFGQGTLSIPERVAFSICLAAGVILNWYSGFLVGGTILLCNAMFAYALGFGANFMYQSAEEIFAEFAALTEGTLCDISSASYDRLKRKGPVQWPYPRTKPTTTSRLYENGRFPTTDGKAAFIAVEHQPPCESPDDDYPLILTTGRIKHHWHTMTRTGKNAVLRRIAPEPILEINRSDARGYHIQDADFVEVISRRGKVMAQARVTEEIVQGTCFLPFHWGRDEGFFKAANNLTISARDPISRQPELKACAEAYKAFPCDKVLKDLLPDCVTPGTRAADEACSYASQCSSLDCKFAPDTACGVCAKIAKRGEACTAADVACDAGLVCTSGVCVYDGFFQAAVGDACQSNADCPRLACASGTHTCAALPTLGMSCAEQTRCGDRSYCNGSSLLCTVRPLPGAQCGFDAAAQNLGACDYGSICNPQIQPSSANCAKIPDIAEPCLKNLDNGEPLPYCADGGYCDTTLASPVCVALHTAGGSCSSSDNECAPGLRCACPDGSTSCMPPFTCIAYHFKGEPCGTPGAVCYPSFTCTNGACQPIDSNGTFANASACVIF